MVDERPGGYKKKLPMDEFNSLPLFSTNFPLTFVHTKVEWHKLTGHCGDCDHLEIPAEHTRGTVEPVYTELADGATMGAHRDGPAHTTGRITSYHAEFYGICQRCKRFTRFVYELHDDFSLSKFTHQPNGDVLWQRWDRDESWFRRKLRRFKRWCKRLFRGGKK